MANPNIFQQYLQPQRSFIDYENDYAKADSLRNQNALQSLTLQQATAVNSQKNALRQAVQGGLDLTSDAGQAQALAVAPDVAPGLIKTVQDSVTSRAQAQKDLGAAESSRATAGKTTQETGQANYTQAMQKVLSFQSPADAVASLNNAVATGKIDMNHAVMMQRSIPTDDPAKFDEWKRNWAVGIADPGKMAELIKPHIQTTNTGGQQVTQAINPITLKPTTVSTLANTQSPDSVATNATTRRGQDMTQQTQFKVSGLDANGNFTAPADGGAQPGAAKNPLDGLVDSIGTYGVKAETALSRMPPAQKAYVLSALASKYPSYDPMTYTERQSGIHSFAPNGNNGKTVQALNVSVDHITKFRDLAAALDNGDNQTLNKVGNAIAQWTGQAAPTNFEAAKNIVMDEITKGVIGSAGGQGDREKMAEVVSKANSPKQLAGALDTVTGLMGGRLEGVEKSYSSSTGRQDFADKYLTPAAKAALEKSSGKKPASAVPDDIAAILARHGAK